MWSPLGKTVGAVVGEEMAMEVEPVTHRLQVQVKEIMAQPVGTMAAVVVAVQAQLAAALMEEMEPHLQFPALL